MPAAQRRLALTYLRRCGRFIDHPQVGWMWECCSQWLLWYFHNDKPPSIMGWLEAHEKPLDSFDTRYDSWLFLYHLAVRAPVLVVCCLRCGAGAYARLYSAHCSDMLALILGLGTVLTNC